jgi:hypothetical protein
MRCPSCGNQKYERLDYAIVRCTNCYSVWNPYIYPGFPEPTVDIGQVWDTTLPFDIDLEDEQGEKEDDLKDWNEEEDMDDDGESFTLGELKNTLGLDMLSDDEFDTWLDDQDGGED